MALSLRIGTHRVDSNRVEVRVLRPLPFGFTSGVLGRSASASFRLQRGLGLANLLQTRLATMQFGRQLVAAPVRPVLSILGPVFGLRLSQPFANLVLQADFLGLPAVVAHRAV